MTLCLISITIKKKNKIKNIYITAIRKYNTNIKIINVFYDNELFVSKKNLSTIDLYSTEYAK